MKATRGEGGFQPITITIESYEEFKGLHTLMGNLCVIDAIGICGNDATEEQVRAALELYSVLDQFGFYV